MKADIKKKYESYKDMERGWEVKVCSPGAGCVEKEQSLSAARHKEEMVTAYKEEEENRRKGVKRMRSEGEERDRRDGREEEGVTKERGLIKQTCSLTDNHYNFL